MAVKLSGAGSATVLPVAGPAGLSIPGPAGADSTVPGPQGQAGQNGNDGKDGIGISPKGSFATFTDLPASAAAGDTYLASADDTATPKRFLSGDGLVWTGAGNDLGPGGNYHNVGPVRGPPGATTVDGLTDATDAFKGLNAEKPDVSETVASRVGGATRALSDILDNSLDVRDFGAKDDDATDNTAAFQAAINAASGKGRTLNVTASAAGTARFRLGSVDWKKANPRFDEGVTLLNLDGSPYTGGYNAPGGGGLVGLVAGIKAAGRRVMAPTGSSIAFSKPGDRKATFQSWSGHTGLPYLVFHSERDAFIYGQEKETSGSVAMDGRFLTIFNASNGPGFNIQCTATNGSSVLTNCTPSPTGTHTYMLDDGTLAQDPVTGVAYQIPNVFAPCRISGPGIPPGSYVKSWDGTTITLGAAGSYTATAVYTGTTGTITINALSGHTEFNYWSMHMDMVGRTGEGGASGGLKFYNDVFAPTNISDNPADQEAYQNGLQIIAYKQVPGLVRDPLHNGSFALVVIHVPTGGQKTFPMHASAALTGYSGNPGLSGGQDPTAGPAALVGLQIGGPLAGSYGAASQRSFYKTGVTIEDYDTAAISIGNPRRIGPFSGTAINVDPEAGNIVAGDSVVVGKHVSSNGPAPTISAGGTLSTGATDLHGTVSCPVGSTGFTITWARAYARSPDVVVSSSTNTQCFYTASASGIVFQFGSLTNPAKFTYHSMGL